MKPVVQCNNEDTECNDRICVEISRDNTEQYTNSMNISNEYSNGSKNNFPKPQSIIEEVGKLSNLKCDKVAFKKLMALLGNSPTALSNHNELNHEETFEAEFKRICENLPNLPHSLIPLVAGTLYTDNNVEVTDEIPTWLDREKFARGQRFARDHLFGIFFADVLSLFTLFSFQDGLKPLIVTGKSAEPYTAFTRYLSTANRVRNWYRSDPFTKGTAAYNDIKIVKKKHQSVRNKLNCLKNEGIDKAATIDNTWSSCCDILLEDFRSLCPAAQLGQCPYAVDAIREVRPCGLNQSEMCATQFGFFGLVILFPEAFGIHSATDEDMEAFCHVWKGIGFLLGIKDEYNFCTGTMNEIKQRSRDFLEFWVKPNLREITPEWEHMGRCMITGMEYYFPGTTYEVSLLYLTELMGLEMPRFHSSLSYNMTIKHTMSKFLMKYLFKFSTIQNLMNKKLNRCMDYALKFDHEKHIELRKKSSNVMSAMSKNERINSNNIVDDNATTSSNNLAKYTQYKIFGVLMVIAQCLILWRITPIFRIL